jgi:hypothetical protein
MIITFTTIPASNSVLTEMSAKNMDGKGDHIERNADTENENAIIFENGTENCDFCRINFNSSGGC